MVAVAQRMSSRFLTVIWVYVSFLPDDGVPVYTRFLEREYHLSLLSLLREDWSPVSLTMHKWLWNFVPSEKLSAPVPRTPKLITGASGRPHGN